MIGDIIKPKCKGEMCFSEAAECGKEIWQGEYCDGMSCAEYENCEALRLFNALPKFAPNFHVTEAKLKNRYPHLV